MQPVTMCYVCTRNPSFLAYLHGLNGFSSFQNGFSKFIISVDYVVDQVCFLHLEPVHYVLVNTTPIFETYA